MTTFWLITEEACNNSFKPPLMSARVEEIIPKSVVVTSASKEAAKAASSSDNSPSSVEC